MSLRHRIWVSSTRTILRFRLSVFVMLCLALGGTSQNIVAPKQILYLLSLGLIGWALSTKKTNYDIRFRQFPLMVAIAFVGLFGLYVLPLPPAIWTHLPGRENIVQGFELANMPLPWLPVSLTPEITLFSLLDFLPPFAIILTLLRSASKQEIKTAFYALLLMAVASVFLGLLQLIAPASGLYLYKIVNVGYPVGFFSNANHQASFLLMVLPFALRLSFANTQDIEIGMMTTTQVRALGIMLTILFLTGISLTGSLAGYLLALPVTLASVIVVGRISKKHLPYFGGLIILILTIVIVDTVFLGGQAGQLMEKVTQDSAISRTSIFATTREAIRDYPLIGTGPGSFHDIYLSYESRETISHIFVPQAHNDYLQLLLELGIAGIALTALMLLWLIKTTFTALRQDRQDNIITLLALIGLISVSIHSTVDYPLRTIAISSVAAFLFAVIIFNKSTSLED